jgi:hypothetical protein
VNFEVAKEILDKTIELGERTNSIFNAVNTINDDALRNELMLHVEHLVKHGNALILKIEKMYPELNPDT